MGRCREALFDARERGVEAAGSRSPPGAGVTCLRVDGNRASIKYRFDHADNPLLLGGGIQIFVEDNGQPEDGQTVDRSSFQAPLTEPVFEATDPTSCEDPNAAAYTPGETGNFVVHDRE